MHMEIVPFIEICKNTVQSEHLQSFPQLHSGMNVKMEFENEFGASLAGNQGPKSQ